MPSAVGADDLALLDTALAVITQRYQVSYEDGLNALVEAGQRTGRTLRALAAEVINTSELEGYPP